MSKKCSRCYEDNDYPVDIKTNIPPTKRWTDINTPAPPPQLNKGLYGGPQNNSSWMGKPVVPTTNAVFVLIATSILVKVDSGVVKSITQSDTEKISSQLSLITRLESKLNIFEICSPICG